MTQAAMTQDWDKTFPKSDRVDQRKVSYTNPKELLVVPGAGPGPCSSATAT